MIKVNYNGVADPEDSYTPFSEGWHKVLIKEAEVKTSENSGNEYLAVTFYSKQIDKQLNDIYSLIPKPFPKKRLRDLIESAGLNWSENLSLNEKDLEGCFLQIEIKNKNEKDANGKDILKNKVVTLTSLKQDMVEKQKPTNLTNPVVQGNEDNDDIPF